MSHSAAGKHDAPPPLPPLQIERRAGGRAGGGNIMYLSSLSPSLSERGRERDRKREKERERERERERKREREIKGESETERERGREGERVRMGRGGAMMVVH